MTTEIRIPKAGMEMVSGRISTWLVSNNAEVVEGQPIYILETDKVELEIEAPTSGTLTQIGIVGEEYQVSDLIAYIE